MRLRHIPGAEEVIEKSEEVIKNGEQYKGSWHKIFKNSNPIEIEIGMGKGRFIMELAQQNPQINYIGIERYSSVLLKALQKKREFYLPNLSFLCIDARELEQLFERGEVKKIYLNFSDPWHKERHAKRRLTSKNFMGVYDKILSQEGVVEFKTDNRNLFDYSLESIPESGWKLKEFTFDLHHSDMNQGNVMTEYEMKFSSAGKPICKLVAFRA